MALAAGLIAVLLCALGASIVGWRYLNTAMPIPAGGASLEVTPGTPLAAVTRGLAGRALLEHPSWLTAYARLRGTATRIHAGEYRLAFGTTPGALLDQLVAGRVQLHQFTIVEGWRFEEALDALRVHPAVVASDWSPEEIMEQLGRAELHWEGQFLPDTYSFPRGTTDVEVLKWAHEALNERLEGAWEARSPGLILDGAYEALTLASIIEKETALASERRLISGVFHRRLERGMRLQTDPTVIYGLGERFDGNLRRADLNRDTPYNTYTRTGLPPTPIALPSEAAIEAAVEPDPGDALYFVATGEPNGSHHFSATLEEHNEAVARYLRRLRELRAP